MSDRLQLILLLSAVFAALVALCCGIYMGIVAFVGGVIIMLAIVGLSRLDK